MKLDRVTITGPDNSIKPSDLIEISQEFPFVEWGILVSASNVGCNRFPSVEWIYDFMNVAEENNWKTSLHLCGKWVRSLLVGDIYPIVFRLADKFARVQLNFHAERNICLPEESAEALHRIGNKQFIFQIDGAGGNEHMDSIKSADPSLNIVGLFDISGGAGILPDEWPTPKPGYDYHGYAGGLGPDCLEHQIPLIAEAAKDSRIWIDMETKVRSNHDRQFDLEKVKKCLEIAKPFVS